MCFVCTFNADHPFQACISKHAHSLYHWTVMDRFITLLVFLDSWIKTGFGTVWVFPLVSYSLWTECCGFRLNHAVMYDYRWCNVKLWLSFHLCSVLHKIGGMLMDQFSLHKRPSFKLSGFIPLTSLLQWPKHLWSSALGGFLKCCSANTQEFSVFACVQSYRSVVHVSF